MKKQYHNFKTHIDYTVYVEFTEKLMNRPKDYLIKLYFQICDFNDDSQICEWDLFECMQLLQSDQMMNLLYDDFKLLLRKLKSKGKTEGTIVNLD